MSKKRYWYGVGRRKEATAIVKLYPKGQGKYMIKKREKGGKGESCGLDSYFGGHKYLLEYAMMPFSILGNGVHKEYDAEIIVEGGGIMGQAAAIRLGFSRALVRGDEENNRPKLKPHGLLKRDARVKERKKPGLKKARKSPQWSKR